MQKSRTHVEKAGQEQIPSVLAERLAAERDPTVIGVICQTLGRLPFSTVDRLRRAEAAILAATAPSSPAPVPLPVLHGVAKGFEALLRRNVTLAPPAPQVVERLRAMLADRRRERTPDAIETAACVRRLAVAALTFAGQADQVALETAWADEDWQVRRLAIAALTAAVPASIPADVRSGLVGRGLRDRHWMVRFEALRVHGRSLPGSGWDPVFDALTDPSAHVALQAIDLLGSPNAPKPIVVDRLRAQIATLPASGATGAASPATGVAPSDWHRAAHAVVALAKVEPDAARTVLPPFLASALWPVRVYGARAATILRDADALARLTGDARANVQEAALSGLRILVGHDADQRYMAALQRPDYSVVATACRALEKTPQPARAVPALLAALARITAERRDTSRDPRTSLLTRIAELGQPGDAPALVPYTTDFDPRVAASAAAIVGKWTGQVPAISPSPLPVTVPSLADVDLLRAARARVTMAGRGVIALELLTADAPGTVARFVRLARAGYYNGLTFHRVVANFLVQGGSPGASEVMGDGPYVRDEVGLQPHLRGSVGISTRGRDTGDAQICPDLVDNPRLDHEYTVFARVVAGLDVLDRILEFDVIERIEILTAPTGRSR
jgi:cyclophilin family peptidyl-prolyl cis-trans isomerase